MKWTPEYTKPLLLLEGPPFVNEVQNEGNNDGNTIGVGSSNNDNLDDGIGVGSNDTWTGPNKDSSEGDSDQDSDNEEGEGSEVESEDDRDDVSIPNIDINAREMVGYDENDGKPFFIIGMTFANAEKVRYAIAKYAIGRGCDYTLNQISLTELGKDVLLNLAAPLCF